MGRHKVLALTIGKTEVTADTGEAIPCANIGIDCDCGDLFFDVHSRAKSGRLTPATIRKFEREVLLLRARLCERVRELDRLIGGG